MRSNSLRTLPGILAIAATLTVAGCSGGGNGGGGSDDGGDDGGEPTPCDTQSPDCAPKPEPSCPDGTELQWNCYYAVGDAMYCEDGADCPPPPPPEECFLECLPVNPCGPGSHEEWVCDVVAQAEENGGTSDGGMLPPDECYLTCIPDNACGPGEHEEFVCEDPGPCSHDKCVEGAALSPQCDPAIDAICAVDAFCCEVAWDGLCVEEVGSVAGEECAPKPEDPQSPPPPPNCQTVCVPDPPGFCGDFICDPAAGEDASSCPCDCGWVDPGFCGDRFCDPMSGEVPDNCPEDCGPNM